MYCGRAWHGDCVPKKGRPPEFPYNEWSCETCRCKFGREQFDRENTPESACRSTTSSPCFSELLNSVNHDYLQSQRREGRQVLRQERSGRIRRSNNQQTEDRRETRASLNAKMLLATESGLVDTANLISPGFPNLTIKITYSISTLFCQ